MTTPVLVRARRARQPFSWQAVLVPLIPIVVGLAGLAAGIGVSRQEAAYEEEGVKVTATVTARDYFPGSGDDADEYRLSYQFDLERGRFIGSGSVSSERYRSTQVGDAVEVTYLASRPSTNRMGGGAPSFAPLLFGGFGAVALLVGVGMLAAAGIGLMRGGRSGPESTGEAPPASPDATYAFQRPMSRVIVDLLGNPIGAVLFLGGAWLLLTGALKPDDNDIVAVVMARTVAPLFFGVFGLLMAVGIPYGIRRGLRRTVLEVGPAGIWTPEMGRLAWNEVGQVRLEAVRGFAGGEHEEEGSSFSIGVGGTTFDSRALQPVEIPTAAYGRLGIVPADPSRTAREKQRLFWRAPSALFSWLRSLRPSSRIPDLEDMAPFGVYAYDIGGSLHDAVAAVRLHHEVSAGAGTVAPASGVN